MDKKKSVWPNPQWYRYMSKSTTHIEDASNDEPINCWKYLGVAPSDVWSTSYTDVYRHIFRVGGNGQLNEFFRQI